MSHRHRIWALLIALTIVASGCGTNSGDANGGGTGGGGTGGGGGGTGVTPGPCAQDRVKGINPLVQAKGANQGSFTTVTNERPMPCGSTIQVNGQGDGKLKLGSAAACDLTQLDEKTAKAVSRTPGGSLFRMERGKILCAVPTKGQIHGCGLGTMSASQGWLGRTRCDPEPEFTVAVYAGSIDVVDPTEEAFTLGPGQELVFDFDTRTSTVFDDASFSDEELAQLEALADEMGMEFPARPSPTQSPPPGNKTPPSIGPGADFGALTADPGTWSGDPTFAYQWEGGCDIEGLGCVLIDGATGQTHAPTPDDCAYVRVIVTAIQDGVSSKPVASEVYPVEAAGGVDCDQVS